MGSVAGGSGSSTKQVTSAWDGPGGEAGRAGSKSIFEAELALDPRRISHPGHRPAGPALITTAARRSAGFIHHAVGRRDHGVRASRQAGAGSDLAALRPARSWTAITSCSTGRRSGPRSGRGRTGSSSSAAPIRDRYGGISFVLCKLDTPGVTIRPLRPDHRRERVRRGLLRGRPRPEGSTWSARSARAGASR